MALISDASFSKNVIKVHDRQVDLFADPALFLLQSSSFQSLNSFYVKWIQSQQGVDNKDLSLKDLKNQIGIVCLLKKGEKKSIQVNYSSSQLKSSVIKNFIFLEESSSLSWFENIDANNLQIETYIYVADQAQIHKLTLNSQSSSLWTVCDLHQKSSLFSFDFHLHSSRQYMKVKGHRSEHLAILRGLNLLHEKQQVYQSVETQHEGEDGYGRQNFFNVLTGKSKSHMHSKVIINAQGTNSHQMLKNLVLSPYAQAKNQPELEVSKDQVKATHGATIGQPNPLEIFYMNTRGIPQKKALEFLIQGWVESALNMDEDEEMISDSLENFIQKVRSIDPLIRNHISRLLSFAS